MEQRFVLARVPRSGGRTTTTDTEIEGEWDEVMAVVKDATAAAGRYGSRVSLVLKADIRPGHDGELDGKIQRMEAAVERLEGR
ncbi:thiamine-binding protein [Brachybacterium aquaticum]|uniref:thiamine-binding protein n=1 Tax=Brachybacterium aquaticum TaxID=1432564 RepID=UPI0028A679DF|nr:thiamine-binding protein [Brachybacterium aquaticum]